MKSAGYSATKDWNTPKAKMEALKSRVAVQKHERDVRRAAT